MTETEKLILEKLDELSQGLKEVNERTTRIEERTTRIELTIENEISKKIDIIGDGHDFLKQRWMTHCRWKRSARAWSLN